MVNHVGAFMFLSVLEINDQITLASTVWMAIVTTIGTVFQVTQLASKKDLKILAAELNGIHMKTNELTMNTATKQEIKDLTTAVVYLSDEVTALSADKLKKTRSEFLAKLFTTK
jgi:hypothetical protein